MIEKRATTRPKITTEETNEQVVRLATQHILPTEISWPKPIVKSRRWWAVAYGLSVGSASLLAARFPAIGVHPWYFNVCRHRAVVICTHRTVGTLGYSYLSEIDRPLE